MVELNQTTQVTVKIIMMPQMQKRMKSLSQMLKRRFNPILNLRRFSNAKSLSLRLKKALVNQRENQPRRIQGSSALRNSFHQSPMKEQMPLTMKIEQVAVIIFH
jgi:hypothetical protein